MKKPEKSLFRFFRVIFCIACRIFRIFDKIPSLSGVYNPRRRGTIIWQSPDNRFVPWRNHKQRRVPVYGSHLGYGIG